MNSSELPGVSPLKCVLSGLLLTVLLSSSAAPAQDAQETDKKSDKKVTTKVVVKDQGEPTIIFKKADPNGEHEEDVLVHGPFHWIGGHPGGGFLGVGLTPLTHELRAHFKAPEDAGIMINHIADDSPAAKAGLQVGDIITKVGDQTVGSPGDLANVIRGQEDGSSVDLEYYRDGKQRNTTAAIEVRDRKVFTLKLDGLEKLEGLEGLEALEGLKGLEALKGLETIHLGPEAAEHVQRALERALSSPEWQQQVERLQEINVDELEAKMEQLKKRLEELERQLKEKFDSP